MSEKFQNGIKGLDKIDRSKLKKYEKPSFTEGENEELISLMRESNNIDPESVGSELEKKEDDIFSSQVEQDKEKTQKLNSKEEIISVLLGSEDLDKKEIDQDLKQQYDRSRVRGSQYSSRNFRDERIKRQMRKDINNLQSDIENKSEEVSTPNTFEDKKRSVGSDEVEPKLYAEKNLEDSLGEVSEEVSKEAFSQLEQMVKSDGGFVNLDNNELFEMVN